MYVLQYYYKHIGAACTSPFLLLTGNGEPRVRSASRLGCRRVSTLERGHRAGSGHPRRHDALSRGRGQGERGERGGITPAGGTRAFGPSTRHDRTGGKGAPWAFPHGRPPADARGGAPGDGKELPRIFQDRSGRAGPSSPSPSRPGHDAAVRGLQKKPQARHQEHSTASRDVTPGARDHERKGGMGISGRPAPGLRTEDARSFGLRCTHPIRGAAPLVTAYS